MHSHADQNKHSKEQNSGNEVFSQEKGSESNSLFTDNRYETINLKRIQELANNSPQVKQLGQLQKFANSNPGNKGRDSSEAITHPHHLGEFQVIQKKSNTSRLVNNDSSNSANTDENFKRSKTNNSAIVQRIVNLHRATNEDPEPIKIRNRNQIKLGILQNIHNVAKEHGLNEYVDAAILGNYELDYIEGENNEERIITWLTKEKELVTEPRSFLRKRTASSRSSRMIEKSSSKMQGIQLAKSSIFKITNKSSDPRAKLLGSRLLEIIGLMDSRDYEPAFSLLTDVSFGRKMNCTIKIIKRDVFCKTMEAAKVSLEKLDHWKNGMHWLDQGKGAQLDLPTACITIIESGQTENYIEWTIWNNPTLAQLFLPVLLEEWIHLLQHITGESLSKRAELFKKAFKKSHPDWIFDEVDIYAFYKDMGWNQFDLPSIMKRYEERSAFEHYEQHGNLPEKSKRKPISPKSVREFNENTTSIVPEDYVRGWWFKLPGLDEGDLEVLDRAFKEGKIQVGTILGYRRNRYKVENDNRLGVYLTLETTNAQEDLN